MDKLPELLNAYMLESGDKPPQVAKKIGVSKMTVYNLLNGTAAASGMRAENAIALARLLKTTAEEMIEGEKTRTLAEIQAYNDVRALQIVTMSMVKALISNVPAAAKPFSAHARLEAAGTEDDKPFDPDYGVLGAALGIAQQAIDRMEADDRKQLLLGSDAKAM